MYQGRSKIGRGSYVDRHSKFAGKNLVGSDTVIRSSNFGKYSYVANNCNIVKLNCGKFCSIGSHVTCGLGQHPKSFVSSHPIFYNKYAFDFMDNKLAYHSFNSHGYTDDLKKWHVEIKNDVWVGNNVTFVDGISVGNGAIIGANSLVTKNVADYSIVAGSPAKILGYRFEPQIIKSLLHLKWWDWEDATVHSYIHLFDNPEKLIEEITNNVD